MEWSAHEVSDNNTVAVTVSREKDDKAGKRSDFLLHRLDTLSEQHK